MRIVLITQVTPASENVRGTSALPYHLMVHRSAGVEIIIYSFNNNQLSAVKIKEVEEELSIKIKLLPRPAWHTWVLRLHLLFFRMLLKYPLFNYIQLSSKIVEEIKKLQPDGIWIYGQDISRVTKQFDGFKRVHTLPDCESLYYYRMLGRRFVFKRQMMFMRNVVMYPKYLRMEEEYENDVMVKYHLVGEADAESLRYVNPGIQAVFLRHPHYHMGEPQKQIAFSRPKIRLLVAGQNNLYMQEAAEEAFGMMWHNARCLKDHYEITFLGRGWESTVVKLQDVGYDVVQITFAPDYIEEIRKHDVQLTPIAIGTGTKGKVLDALANGLLVVGTSFAVENIAVETGVSCVEYHSNEELLATLTDIPHNVEKYERMAEKGREAILTEHSRKRISEQLMELFK
ncbi:glycosyltransferase [Hoylesella pleuritidis]|uniref:glycosyltransferase n=1 Tax=Hoylesella pleuritidis TaxID=407975 RepID=UPI00235259B9|nr:glycosyltransferase [Hoylesella pleuritidis]